MTEEKILRRIELLSILDTLSKNYELSVRIKEQETSIFQTCTTKELIRLLSENNDFKKSNLHIKIPVTKFVLNTKKNLNVDLVIDQSDIDCKYSLQFKEFNVAIHIQYSDIFNYNITKAHS